MPSGEPLLSILIPIYNERQTLPVLMNKVLSVPFQIPFEVVAVDDCSRDGSAELLSALSLGNGCIRPFFHRQNRGKAAAVHTAIKEMKGDIAIIQDADLEYDPGDIPRVIQPILDGRADAVYGSRFSVSACMRVSSLLPRLANQLLTFVTNVTCGLNLTDMETCYKACRADILRQLRLNASGFALEPEITVRLKQWGARVCEVPINYWGRSYQQGKKITWKDGLQALWVLIFTAYIDKQYNG